jgi:DNA-binding transcriptional MerR regulator
LEKKRLENIAKPGSVLKMKELVAATGVPKSTILHYIKEGLLPQPVKTSRNMSRYHPSMVERIGYIKQMQQKHRLPLSAIKKLLHARDTGRDPDQLMALQEVTFGPARETMDRETFLAVSGMSSEGLGKSLELGLLMPLKDGSFDQEDLAIARIYKSLGDLGIESSQGTYYRELAEKIVDHEMELRKQITQNLPAAEDAVITMEMTRAARAMRAYIIDRVFLHRVMGMACLKDDDES